MKKQIDYACLIEMVAEMEGCSVAEIRQEIEKAILDAMQNKDPSVQEHWKAMSPDGKIPTVEEVMQYLMKLMMERFAICHKNEEGDSVISRPGTPFLRRRWRQGPRLCRKA
mgnify:CR=1 FL=1